MIDPLKLAEGENNTSADMVVKQMIIIMMQMIYVGIKCKWKLVHHMVVMLQCLQLVV